MTNLLQALQVALRERRRIVLLTSVGLVLTMVCAVSGPFGTHNALTLTGRVGYWGIVVAASILGSMLPIMHRDGVGVMRFVVWSGYVLCLSTSVYVLNALVFEDQRGFGQFIYMLGIVALIVCAVHAILWAIDFARPVPKSSEFDPEVRFLRRLPLAARGPLVRIEAQDHYLKVVTVNGSALILLRLSEAVEELAETKGALVHRSHWVAKLEVMSHRRAKGRDLLLMSDGIEVPVSRSNRTKAQSAGLL